MNKIGLLDQYTGSNLGDAAIQEAVIENIRKRKSEAGIFLFTLYPEETQRLHNLMSYPVPGFRLTWYSDCSGSENADNITSRVEESVRYRKLIHVLKKIPLVFPVLKMLKAIFRSLINVLSKLYGELIHIRNSYRILKGFDLLIVSGGGQLDDDFGGPWGHPYALFKWALLAKATRTRFIFLSVGACSIRYKLSRFFIKHALQLASYRSYRDEGTKSLVKDYSFSKEDPVVPDLAFSFSLNGKLSEEHTMKNAGRTTVGISPIAYLSNFWPRTDLKIYEKYKHELAVFTNELIKKGYLIAFFSSDNMDSFVTDEIIDILKDKIRDERCNSIVKLPIVTLTDLLHELPGVDYVVASRLHGILLSHLFEKPVLAISYDRKVDAHMTAMGQMHYSADIHGFTSDELMVKFSALQENNAVIRNQIENRKNAFKERLALQYDHILSV